MKKIILGVTGSIAAYKAADLTNRLVEAGHEVNVVMTRAGAAFITPLTMQSLSKRPVYTEVLQEQDATQIVHINLTQSADCFLIAPATANIIGKLAHGIGDDMLSTMALALRPDTPKLIAPAMNHIMYASAPVQENLRILRECGWVIVEPRESRLACGDIGKGALATIDTLVAALELAL
jgi:Phosphopantothenoylcysteine synthetase/decarboxylase